MLQAMDEGKAAAASGDDISHLSFEQALAALDRQAVLRAALGLGRVHGVLLCGSAALRVAHRDPSRRQRGIAEEMAAGLDEIDETPVVDIKPWMVEFGPRGEVLQPSWSTELMKGYW